MASNGLSSVSSSHVYSLNPEKFISACIQTDSSKECADKISTLSCEGVTSANYHEFGMSRMFQAKEALKVLIQKNKVTLDDATQTVGEMNRYLGHVQISDIINDVLYVTIIGGITLLLAVR